MGRSGGKAKLLKKSVSRSQTMTRSKSAIDFNSPDTLASINKDIVDTLEPIADFFEDFDYIYTEQDIDELLKDPTPANLAIAKAIVLNRIHATAFILSEYYFDEEEYPEAHAALTKAIEPLLSAAKKNLLKAGLDEDILEEHRPEEIINMSRLYDALKTVDRKRSVSEREAIKKLKEIDGADSALGIVLNSNDVAGGALKQAALIEGVVAVQNDPELKGVEDEVRAIEAAALEESNVKGKIVERPIIVTVSAAFTANQITPSTRRLVPYDPTENFQDQLSAWGEYFVGNQNTDPFVMIYAEGVDKQSRLNGLNRVDVAKSVARHEFIHANQTEVEQKTHELGYFNEILTEGLNLCRVSPEFAKNPGQGDPKRIKVAGYSEVLPGLKMIFDQAGIPVEQRANLIEDLNAMTSQQVEDFFNNIFEPAGTNLKEVISSVEKELVGDKGR